MKDGHVEIVKRNIGLQQCMHTKNEVNHSRSYSEYRDLANRHVRTEEDPKSVLSKPLTVGQEVGWNIQNAETPIEIKGRKSCPETVYADELTKSGIIY